MLGDINVWMLDSINVQNIRFRNICFESLEISAYQTFVYQMDISGYMWKCLSLQGFVLKAERDQELRSLQAVCNADHIIQSPQKESIHFC